MCPDDGWLARNCGLVHRALAAQTKREEEKTKKGTNNDKRKRTKKKTMKFQFMNNQKGYSSSFATSLYIFIYLCICIAKYETFASQAINIRRDRFIVAVCFQRWPQVVDHDENNIAVWHKCLCSIFNISDYMQNQCAHDISIFHGNHCVRHTCFICYNSVKLLLCYMCIQRAH